MGKDNEPWFKSSVVGPLIVVAVGSFVVWLVPGGWDWASSLMKAAWAWLTLPVSISRWLIAVLVLCALAGGGIVVIALIAANSKEDKTYTEDTFFGLRWRWRYGQMGIWNVAPFCPHCDPQIHPRSEYGSFYGGKAWVYSCEDSGQIQSLQDHPRTTEDVVKRKIQQKLRAEMKQ